MGEQGQPLRDCPTAAAAPSHGCASADAAPPQTNAMADQQDALASTTLPQLAHLPFQSANHGRSQPGFSLAMTRKRSRP
ncbi:MAG: hypothetical protein TQ37_03210 [Candidatus Synechococcus spongiarum 15L]|uniref:Uncharacterized protein n=1 Tax=Candidatus Synechococcus spongiarum 15L TaxID=1608419 RepID=A0A0G8AWT7_9SYNE|nr:MAG: hypothetical protein TQ37_03210 [Candidatus Synechococcus spongiarum 15L]